MAEEWASHEERRLTGHRIPGHTRDQHICSTLHIYPEKRLLVVLQSDHIPKNPCLHGSSVGVTWDTSRTSIIVRQSRMPGVLDR